MRIPKEIHPDPLILSTVEIRFHSEINSEDLLNVAIGLFSKNFPKIKNLGINRQLQIPMLEYFAEYTFSNDNYSVSIGDKVISFENVSNYKLWENYFPVIQENLLALLNTGKIKTIERIGVRYANVFDKRTKIQDVLNIKFEIPNFGFEQENKNYNTLIKLGEINLFLQLSETMKANQRDGTEVEGVYLDIDASLANGFANFNAEKLFETIDQLHAEEKKLFYTLVKEDIINQLSPKY